jgi:hypothetical protein
MHIESTTREGPTIEANLDIDDPINIFLKTKKQKKK